MHRKIAATLLMAVVMMGTICFGSFSSVTSVSAAETKTGTGLAEHVLKAYNEGWKYSYGAYGQLSGGTRITDCAGLIKSYLWWAGDNANPKAGSISVGGGASAMLNSATEKGTINYSDSSSLPRIHGLILYQPGHVGVYVGNNMAVDNRDYGMDVKYEPVFGRARNKWTMWFKLPQITYPTTGFAEFQGKTYYYENGEYVVDTQRTIGDTIYTFGSDGTIIAEEPTAAALAEQAEIIAKIEAAKNAQKMVEEDFLPEEGEAVTDFVPTSETSTTLSVIPGSPAARAFVEENIHLLMQQEQVPLATASYQENIFPLEEKDEISWAVILLCGASAVLGIRILNKRSFTSIHR